jgi:hypothetical protein
MVYEPDSSNGIPPYIAGDFGEVHAVFPEELLKSSG